MTQSFRKQWVHVIYYFNVPQRPLTARLRLLKNICGRTWAIPYASFPINLSIEGRSIYHPPYHVMSILNSGISSEKFCFHASNSGRSPLPPHPKTLVLLSSFQLLVSSATYFNQRTTSAPAFYGERFTFQIIFLILNHIRSVDRNKASH